MAISYVGGVQGGRAGSTSTTTQSLNGTLTGGSDTSPSAGDLVVVWCSVGTNSSYLASSQIVSGNNSGTYSYTTFQSQADTYYSQSQLNYKIQGATVDTSLTIPSSGSNLNAQRWIVHVFRGVSASSPFDVTPVPSSGDNTGRPNPTAITPSTAGAWIVAYYASVGAFGEAYTSPGLSGWLGGATDDNYDVMQGGGYYSSWTSGEYDPPAIAAGGTTGTGDSWTGMTIALRASEQNYDITKTSAYSVLVPMNFLSDNFDDNSFDSTKWTRSNATQITESSQQLNLATTTSAAYYVFNSKVNHNLTGDSIYLNLKDAGDTTITSYEAYPLQLFKDSNNGLSICVIGSDIYFRKKVGGSYSTLATQTYSSTDHAWLKIREAGGTVYFDRSEDGVSWTNVTSATVASLFDISSVQVDITAGTWQTEASTTTMVIDNFNVPPPISYDLTKQSVYTVAITRDYGVAGVIDKLYVNVSHGALIYYSVGQTFTGNGDILHKTKASLYRYGSPTGNVVSKIYAHTGTFGADDGLPTGDALAVSDNYDVTTIGTSPSLVTFQFSGVNNITLQSGVHYVMTVEGNGWTINASNKLRHGMNNQNTHAGRAVYGDIGAASYSTVAESSDFGFEVLSAPSEITAEYLVAEANDTTKQAVYTVSAIADDLTKQSAYTVPTTATIDKAASYQVATVHSIDKAVDYDVAISSDMQKAAAYAVAHDETVTKGSLYAVAADNELIAQAQYYVLIVPAVIQKPSDYDVAVIQTIQKAIGYVVLHSTDLTQNSTYVVISGEDITAVAQYQVPHIGDIQKSSQYTVPTQADVTKQISYAVAVSSDVDKSVSYTVPSSSDITKTAAYVAQTIGTTAVTKNAQYAVETIVFNTIQSEYTVAVERSIGDGEVVCDYYPESNYYTVTQLRNGSFVGISQAFTGNGGILSKSTFYLNKTGSPVGNVVSKVYAITGTYGSSAKPTGAALATSQPVDASTLSTSRGLIDFIFTGNVTLSNATYYAITVEFSGGSTGNTVEVGNDTSNPYTHSGNWGYKFGTTWMASSTGDAIFYVYTQDTGKIISYCVEAEHTITKSAQYAVIGSDDISKIAQYVVQSVSGKTELTQYAVLAESAVTKSSQYVVQTITDITKAVTYVVVLDSAVQKSAQYVVISGDNITLAAQYSVSQDNSVTLQAAYEIIRITDIQLLAVYDVLHDYDVWDITKPVVYTTHSHVGEDDPIIITNPNRVLIIEDGQRSAWQFKVW